MEGEQSREFVSTKFCTEQHELTNERIGLATKWGKRLVAAVGAASALLAFFFLWAINTSTGATDAASDASKAAQSVDSRLNTHVQVSIEKERHTTETLKRIDAGVTELRADYKKQYELILKIDRNGEQ